MTAADEQKEPKIRKAPKNSLEDWTDQDDLILKENAGNMSVGDIAKLVNSTKQRTTTRMRRLGLDWKTKKPMSDEKEKMIIERYLAGESTAQIGRDIGMWARSVHGVLTKNGINTRSHSIATGGLNEEQIEAAKTMYQKGVSSNAIAAIFGCSASCVNRTLDRIGVQKRTGSEYQKGLADKSADIKSMYLSGNDLQSIANKFDITIGSVRSIIDKADRSSKIKSMYLSGNDLQSIANEYGLTIGSICRILDKEGVSRRDPSIARGGVEPFHFPYICKMYREGKTIDEIAELYCVTGRPIATILRNQDVEIREAINPYDSVERVLDGSDSMWMLRPCTFYIYDLARFPELYSKPGITFDVKTRVDEEYGKEWFAKIFKKRAEAFAFEQAVLQATKSKAIFPEELRGWEGAYELREISPPNLVELAEELLIEYEELGFWEFVIMYVPMTSDQLKLAEARRGNAYQTRQS